MKTAAQKPYAGAWFLKFHAVFASLAFSGDLGLWRFVDLGTPGWGGLSWTCPSLSMTSGLVVLACLQRAASTCGCAGPLVRCLLGLCGLDWCRGCGRVAGDGLGSRGCGLLRRCLGRPRSHCGPSHAGGAAGVWSRWPSVRGWALWESRDQVKRSMICASKLPT